MNQVERPSWMSVAVAHSHEMIGKLDQAESVKSGFFLNSEESVFCDEETIPLRQGQGFGLEKILKEKHK